MPQKRGPGSDKDDFVEEADGEEETLLDETPDEFEEPEKLELEEESEETSGF